MTQKPSGPRGVLKHDYLGLDSASIKRSLANRLIYSVGKDPYTATDRDWFHTVAYLIRDRLIERWMETQRACYHGDVKRVYYLSLEFLIGRTLSNSLLNMDFHDECRSALADVGLDLERLQDMESDAALGNGGLGRLAACILDSMATLRLPGYGYGIRYEYGLFKQGFEDGYQVEHPENWLRYGNPWEFPRPEVLYPVKFYGQAVELTDEQGRMWNHWVNTEEVMALAYDTPIPGYQTNTVNNLRLWSARSSRDFNLQYFNEGDYIRALETQTESENLSRVLYPDDTSTIGRELRLKQEYFFVCASLQDILRRFLKHHDNLDQLPDKVVIQLNDTHPSIAVPELMRVLVDLHRLEWDRAWDITTRVFAYTNHTLMPEALETWPVSLLATVLPRHLQIIYEINRRFLHQVAHRWPGDTERMRRMSLVDEGGERSVRMAHLATVGSHRVNGVSRIHTHLMKDTIFSDFEQFFPNKIVNITNGVTPRRWLHHTNPALAQLLIGRIGRGWITDLGQLRRLKDLAADSQFQDEFRAVKLANKTRLAQLIERHLGVVVDTASLFDVQVKRIHEYKRQLLNILHVIALYNQVRDNPQSDRIARTVIFSGKAAPGYRMAKLIIKLIHDVADVINQDPAVRGILKIVYIPNYDVSTAEDIIPAAELSEQISTAGTEASGTGNMKLALNGALTIGTLDGANVEIREEVGADHIFIFGHRSEEVAALKRQGYRPDDYVSRSPELRRTLDMIGSGFFSPDQPERFRAVIHSLTTGGDPYLVLADFDSYLEIQRQVDALYRDPPEWTRWAILNVAAMERFSSDRTVQDYAKKVWNVHPVAHE
ncbi:MAG TPA: glycogen/starch/alpha-glucan phosphorylase [Gammaproteobacteria bacterium]|nr:glycogen/starch/alpha-glucan phosphorylase [Gammaproteobacteria bacterium]